MKGRIVVVRRPGPDAENGSRRRATGLPGPLPPGETLLWQGAPDWRSLCRRVLHVPKLAAYFGLLALACLVRALVVDTLGAWCALAALVVLAAVALGLLAVFAVLVARTTVYTLTDRRVVMRVGVALGFSINLPFAAVERAAARVFPDGTGDLALLLQGGTRVGWVTLWPHVRPWRTRRVEPMLRCVPGAARVGQMLGRALAEHPGAGPAVRPTPVPTPASTPVPTSVPMPVPAHGDAPGSLPHPVPVVAGA